jgi:hypothetical protein
MMAPASDKQAPDAPPAPIRAADEIKQSLPPGGDPSSTDLGLPKVQIVNSLREIQREQAQSSQTGQDGFEDELSNEQFGKIEHALVEEGCEDRTEDPEDLDRIEALLPMRAIKLDPALSAREPRAFFRTIDKDSIVVYDQTGSPLDEIIKMVVHKANHWIATEGIEALNESRELSALKRGVPVPPKLLPGRLRLFVRPRPAGSPGIDDIKDELDNISKDLYLWLGRDENLAKLGANSSLCSSLWTDWVVHKILTFLLKGKKDRDFKAVKSALSGLRGAGWVSRKNFVGNLRVIFGIINKFFFEAFMNISYAAMQNSTSKLTPAKINGELGYKSHNIEVLTRCLTAEERLVLTPWLTSKEAQDLKDLTKQVFSDKKFKLLPRLTEASNAWDKCVSKALIKLLYKRNRERSNLQSRVREEAQRRAKASGLKPKDVVVRQITYDEVKRSFIEKKDYLPISTPLLEVCFKFERLDYERALSFGSRAFIYYPTVDQWNINPQVFENEEPLFEAFPDLEEFIRKMFSYKKTEATAPVETQETVQPVPEKPKTIPQMGIVNTPGQFALLAGDPGPSSIQKKGQKKKMASK